MAESARRARGRGARSAGVLLLYVLIALVLTYPMGLQALQNLSEHDIDVWIALWNDWWFRQAVSSGESLYATPMLFYPSGLSLVAHSHSPLFSAVSAVLFPLAGAVGAYNLSTLMIFVLGAWGMYLLACEITACPNAALVAGITYAFSPYYVSQALAHPNLASVQWLPYTALLLRRTLRGGRILDALGSGFFFSLTVWSGLQLGLLGSMWAVAFVAWAIASKGKAWRQTPWAALGLAALTATVLSRPAIVPVLRAWEMGAPPQDLLLNEWELGQTDLLAYAIPPRYHPVWGSAVFDISARFPKNRKWIPYLGLVPVALAVYAAVKERRAARFWWISGLLWILLALGAYPRINGHTYPSVRLPYALIGQRFPFSTLRSADRFNLLVPLSLAVLVGIALGRWKRRWWTALAALAIAFEYLFVPIPMQAPLTISPFIAEMSADQEQYAVLDLPMSRQFSKQWMYMQTVHGKPLVEGMAARTSPQAYALVWSVPLLQAFRSPDFPAPGDISEDLCRLAGSGVRYILIHTDFAPADDLRRWESWFHEPPIYEDERLIVYPTDLDRQCPAGLSAATPPGKPLDYRLEAGIRLVAWDPGWDGPAKPGDTLRYTLYWACDAAPGQSFHVFNHLMSEGELVAQEDGPPVSGEYTTDLWEPGSLVADQRALVLPGDLHPGQYRLLAGLYSLETEERLPASDGHGMRLTDDAIPLGEVEIR